MAYYWKVNQTSDSGTVRYWDLIETMLTAGWTMPNAGDGTNVGPNQVTHPGTTLPGAFDVPGAWVRMQDPAGGREIIIQRGADSVRWNIVYSKAAKFVDGTPSGTVRPTATDEYVVIISSAAAFSPILMCRHHAWASDVSPYPFYLVAYDVSVYSGNLSYRHFTMFEELDTIDGVEDPVVFIRGGNNLGNFYSLANSVPAAATVSTLQISGWIGPVCSPLSLHILWEGQGSGYAANKAPNSGNLKCSSAANLVLRRNIDPDPFGMLKGTTRNFLAAGSLRSTGESYDLLSPRDRLHIQTGLGGFVLPWNGSVPLV